VVGSDTLWGFLGHRLTLDFLFSFRTTEKGYQGHVEDLDIGGLHSCNRMAYGDKALALDGIFS
jgi:hypothetical protein